MTALKPGPFSSLCFVHVQVHSLHLSPTFLGPTPFLLTSSLPSYSSFPLPKYSGLHSTKTPSQLWFPILYIPLRKTQTVRKPGKVNGCIGRVVECILGGKLCFNLSALSESFSTSVYRKRLHRILNLMSELLEDFFTRAARKPESMIIQRVFSAEKRRSGLGGNVVAGCGGMDERIGGGHTCCVFAS